MPESLPLVLLHGWGFDSRIWEAVLPLLREAGEVITLDLPGFGNAAADDDVLSRLPPRSILLGWSLGGLIATQIAIQHPERVAALITVGSNLKWVADKDWPGASADNFAAFFENLAQDFENTKRHFCGVIARGDRQEKALVKILREKISTAPQEHFLQGLRLLDSLDNREGYATLKMPGLHLFGEQDAMVPQEVVQRMQALNKRQHIRVIPATAHAPFLSAPEPFMEILLPWIRQLPYRLDKQRIAQSFSKAAPGYDKAAQLQRRIGDDLLLLLPEQPPQVVLDLGCGTGMFSRQLQQRYPAAAITSLDIAMGMLAVTQARSTGLRPVCADAEQLPFRSNSFDVVFSNLAIQWCQQPVHLFAEIHRVLVPGGVCLLSTFTQGTLQELDAAWQQVDDAVHTNHFPSAQTLCEAAEAFADMGFWQETHTRYYGSVSGLMRELKAIGAHNLNAGRRRGLTGKGQLLQLARAYEPLREHGQLPARYVTLLMVLKKEKQNG